MKIVVIGGGGLIGSNLVSRLRRKGHDVLAVAALAEERKISQQDAMFALLSDKPPSRNFVTPEQLGGTVSYLCSAAADQITGTTISVDGGWTAQ